MATNRALDNDLVQRIKTIGLSKSFRFLLVEMFYPASGPLPQIFSTSSSMPHQHLPPVEVNTTFDLQAKQHEHDGKRNC